MRIVAPPAWEEDGACWDQSAAAVPPGHGGCPRLTRWPGVRSCRRFLIGREKPGEQSEVTQLIQQTLEQERWQREMMEQRYTQYTEEDEEVRGVRERHFPVASGQGLETGACAGVLAIPSSPAPVKAHRETPPSPGVREESRPQC